MLGRHNSTNPREVAGQIAAQARAAVDPPLLRCIGPTSTNQGLKAVAIARTYLGQSLLGYLVCSAARYGRAEEWELDGDASGPGGGVAILCVGANWGSGGWLEANPAAGTVQVGGSSGPAARKRAALWRVDQVEAGGDS